jgi:hypothetical protein
MNNKTQKCYLRLAKKVLLKLFLHKNKSERKNTHLMRKTNETTERIVDALWEI